MSALAVPVAGVTLRAAGVVAPGFPVLRALGFLRAVERRVVSPVTLLGSVSLLAVLEAATGLLFPLLASLALLTGLILLLSELGVILSGFRSVFVAALESLLAAAALGTVLAPVALTALAALVLLLSAIAASSSILLVLLFLHLRRATGHAFVDTAVLTGSLLTLALLTLLSLLVL